MTKTCVEPGCTRTKIKARGRCQPHYRALKATNNPCQVEGCTRGVDAARGMCAAHYGMWRRTGNPDTPPARNNIATTDLAEELVWLLDSGESPWQAAKQINVTPKAILNRFRRRVPDVPDDVRRRLLDEYTPWVDQ